MTSSSDFLRIFIFTFLGLCILNGSFLLLKGVSEHGQDSETSVIARDEDTLSVRMKMKELSFLNVVLAYITAGSQNNWLYCRFGSVCELAVVFCSIGHIVA